MKKMVVLVLYFFSTWGIAQIPFDTIRFEAKDSIVDIENIPLDVLMDLAVQNSAIIKATHNQFLAEESKKRIEQRRILSGISLIGSYNYGNTGVISFQEDNASAVPYNVQSSTTLSRYLVGANVKIPLDQIFNRKDQILLVERNMEMRKELMNKEIEVLHSTVFDFYNRLLLTRKLIEIYSSAVESSELNMQMAQKKFIQGELEIADLTRVNEGYVKSAVQYENTKSDYRSIYSQLELLIGLKIKEIK